MTTLTAATPAMGGALAGGQQARPSPAVASAVTGADVVRILRQRLLLICIVWFLLIGMTVAFSLFMRLKYPEYSARSLIRVESISPPNVTDPLKRELVRQEEIDRELQNQVLLVRSPAVQQKALQDPDLQRTVWFLEAEEEVRNNPNESMVDLLDDTIRVSSIRESNFLSVGASWRIPNELPTLVNTVVQKYVDEIDRQQKSSMRAAEEQLGVELSRAAKQYEGQKQDIQDFRSLAEFSTITSQEADERLLTLTALVTELEIDTLGRKTQWEVLQQARPEELPITAELQAILEQDPLINQLDQALLFAEQNLDLALQRFGPNHRVVKESRETRDAVANRVAQERAVKTLQYKTRQIEQAQRNFLEAQNQTLELTEKLIEAQQAQRDKDVKKARYESMLDDQELYRYQYESLLEKKNLLSMTLRQKRTVQIEVQSRAIIPKRISSPQLTIWIPAGTLLGLALSVGLAFLLELTDTSVRTPRDVLRSQIPVLGTIPTTDDDEIEIDSVEKASLEAPQSIVAEAFRNLRANLFFSAPAEQQGVILVTSPSGGNGKTTVATNLAISIALSGRRVLLIDANFRRASLPRIFANMNTEGLSNILIGQGFLGDFVSQTPVPGLDVLGAGPIPPNPAELLGSSYLRDVVVDARSRYDQVIFDGPPVLLVSDAMVLAGAVDGCILVCQYRATSRGALYRTQSSLRAINARVFGAVLNQVQSRAGGYFRKAYREFYEYQEPDDEDTDTPRMRLDLGGPEASHAAAATDELQDRPDVPGGGGGGEAEPMGASDSGDPLEPLDEDTFAPDDDLPDVDLPDLDAVGEIDGLGDDEVIPRDDLSGDSAGMDEPSPAPDFAEDDFWVGPRTETQPPSSSDPLPDDLEEGQSLGDELVDLDGDDFKIEDSGILGDDLPDDETSSDDEDGSHSP